MLTKEGSDSTEVIVRPSCVTGWIVEIPSLDGFSIAYASTRERALELARTGADDRSIRILPARDSGLVTAREDVKDDMPR